MAAWQQGALQALSFAPAEAGNSVAVAMATSIRSGRKTQGVYLHLHFHQSN